ncbi:hypothetical protein SD28_07125 [Allofrancisella guangzhouensis]|uniref:Uncharacterized protein n=2 Tax=Allofrancisella guangzhouensis TaxID=594679 RepID=A0A0A8E725_9GAMM|nr:hypothetical protein [Allofrancisella guangzhouensis]AJC49402.1 hypothetical protein SD28_07125 [Allofrancisella guangzhouensis]MBK2046011.1 hypothetical protein [Allofrancisella guangzhouensis]
MFILAFILFSNTSYRKITRYYCPDSSDFNADQNGSNTLRAKTNYNNLKIILYAKDNKPTGLPEFPQVFRSLKLINCTAENCQPTYLYYSNIENYIIQASSDKNQNITVDLKLNNYLIKNFCQFMEHVDCPFFITYKITF